MLIMISNFQTWIIFNGFKNKIFVFAIGKISDRLTVWQTRQYGKIRRVDKQQIDQVNKHIFLVVNNVSGSTQPREYNWGATW
jgi:hypothetical protein